MADQGNVLAVADQLLDGTGEGIEAAGEEDDLVGPEAARIRRFSEIQVRLKRRQSGMPHEIERVVVLREKAERFRERCEDRRRRPEVRSPNGNPKREIAPPIRSHVAHEIGTALGELVGAVNVGGDLHEVGQDIGNVLNHARGDIPDLEIDFGGSPLLGLGVEFDDPTPVRSPCGEPTAKDQPLSHRRPSAGGARLSSS
jgi:hypothetical protein